MKPRVYVTRRLPNEVLEEIRKFATLEVYCREEMPVSRQELLSAVQGVDGVLSMLTETIDAEVLDAAGLQLKIVANMAVGYDNISLEDAIRRGVMVTNTPDVLTETTADLVFALLLASARRIAEADCFVRNGGWKTWSPMLLTGMDVFGATLGIIGMGRIGEAVVRRAGGFNMNILYHNRSRRFDMEEKYGCVYKSLPELLAKSDFIVPLVPLSEETKGLIGENELACMKPDAVLINASRGAVVDQEALYQALKEHQIRSAGLDVFEREPISANNPLLSLENTVLLPHIGSATRKTRIQMALVAVENLHAALTGNKPPNRVA